MEEFLNSLLPGLRLAFAIGVCSAAFTLGVSTICRWLKWAPLNLTINVYGVKASVVDDDGNDLSADR